jgi:folate-dependent phosphoribosylglycinamide formyltransferase PurN
MLIEPLHIGVLCSSRAPGLDALLRNPQHGVLYNIDCVISTELSFPEVGVPVITHPIDTFYDTFGAAKRDMRIRTHYDAATAEMLSLLGVDAVVMLGYLYVVTSPLLALLPDRIFSVHDADLLVRRGDGRPKFPGLHATRDAILAGEKSTRSSVHLVTADVDGGPVVARSHAYDVAPFAIDAARAGHTDIVRAYAYAHREWMMRDSWSDLVVEALEEVALLEDHMEAAVV